VSVEVTDMLSKVLGILVRLTFQQSTQLIRDIWCVQFDFTLSATKGWTLSWETLSLAISAWFNLAQNKMFLWEIMIDLVVRIAISST